MLVDTHNVSKRSIYNHSQKEIRILLSFNYYRLALKFFEITMIYNLLSYLVQIILNI